MRSPRFRLHILQRRLRAWLGTGPIDWDEPRLRGYLRDKLVGLDPEKCRLCHLLARATGAMRIVEVGTSFGLSTIYLAAAVRDNSLTTGGQGVVIGTENEPSKAEQARLNLADAGLAEWAEVREGDFRITLRDIREPIDLVLMDIWAPLARPALDLLVPHLRDRAMVVCDNIVAARREYRDYLELVRNPANGFASVTLPFKGGLELSVRLIGEATPPEPG
ncbi:O-methyltransferase [Allosphingosinicella sp.]|uniref:O-methyltransferase n=1 Tax=Allosphingosinicella sp. TaxID=2823234 RepID=UPI003D749C2F